MDPDENGTEELEAVPSDMFDSSPSPASSGLGWAGQWGAAAAGTALFAVRTESPHLACSLLPHTPHPRTDHAPFGSPEESAVRGGQKGQLIYAEELLL